jgi:hypothetical protein
LRTRVGAPKLRLITTSPGPAGGNPVAHPREVSVDEAQELLAQALPAEAHAAFETAYHQRQLEARHRAANVDRLRYAVVDLTEIDLSPEQLIDALDPSFDEPVVRERIIRALDCLTRIAEEWWRRNP